MFHGQPASQHVDWRPARLAADGTRHDTTRHDTTRQALQEIVHKLVIGWFQSSLTDESPTTSKFAARGYHSSRSLIREPPVASPHASNTSLRPRTAFKAHDVRSEPSHVDRAYLDPTPARTRSVALLLSPLLSRLLCPFPSLPFLPVRATSPIHHTKRQKTQGAKYSSTAVALFIRERASAPDPPRGSRSRCAPRRTQPAPRSPHFRGCCSPRRTGPRGR